jgi:hypothetical protein
MYSMLEDAAHSVRMQPCRVQKPNALRGVFDQQLFSLRHSRFSPCLRWRTHCFAIVPWIVSVGNTDHERQNLADMHARYAILITHNKPAADN